MNITEAFRFNDASAESLLRDSKFTTTLWELARHATFPMIIKTKSDYLYVGKYTIKQVDNPSRSITVVARPIESPDAIPKITSMIACLQYTHLTYDDGFQ